MTTQSDTNFNRHYIIIVMIIILALILSAILASITVKKFSNECERLGGKYGGGTVINSCYKEKDGELIKYKMINLNGKYGLVRE